MRERYEKTEILPNLYDATLPVTMGSLVIEYVPGGFIVREVSFDGETGEPLMLTRIYKGTEGAPNPEAEAMQELLYAEFPGEMQAKWRGGLTVEYHQLGFDEPDPIEQLRNLCGRSVEERQADAAFVPPQDAPPRDDQQFESSKEWKEPTGFVVWTDAGGEHTRILREGKVPHQSPSPLKPIFKVYGNSDFASYLMGHLSSEQAADLFVESEGAVAHRVDV